MEDNGPLTSNILNRNWVLKRKRRKIPFGPDKSNGNKNNGIPSESDATASPTLKDDVASLRSSSKKKGNDGYYYECVVCDLGGNLLCCDSCPETYHLQCLDPPLKRIPNGKWQCPKCCLKNNSADAIDNLDPISRARTKIVVGKSKSGTKAVRTDKVSRILGSSILGKKESSGKVKSSLSCEVGHLSSNIKISHPSADGSAEVTSSFSNVDNKKKLELSPNDALEKTKSVSSGKSVLSLSKVTELKTDEETSGNKPDVSCNNGSPGNNDIPKVDASVDKAKKRKRKVPSGHVQKKPRTDKGRVSVDNIRKRGSKAHLAFPGTSKPQRKRIAVGYGTSASLSENHLSREIVDVQLKDEIVFEEAGNEPRKVEVETLADEDHIREEFQQVDRVLGCRVQGSAPISLVDTDDTHAEDIAILGIQNRPTEDLSCNTKSQMLDSENLTAEANNILCHSDGLTLAEGMRVEKVEVDGGSTTNDCSERDATPILTSEIKNSDSSAVDDASKDTPALREQIPTAENVDVNLRQHDNSELTEGCETLDFPDTTDKNGVKSETETISSHKKINGESTLAVSLPSNGESILYEFLVKWVGKSHIHNSWVSESQLKVLAKRKLDNFKAKYGTMVINICEEQWKIPQRVIALRSSASGLTEAFVKWTALHYDECTWEKIEDPVIANSSHLIDLFQQFEKRAFEKDAAKDETQRRKGHMQQTDVVALNDQPKELIGGSLFPHQLEALNWLRKCWHKSKNVILADEMGLGKTVSALAFISSLNFEFKVRLPCLVLVPLSTMPNWLSEFSLWAPNLNVVEYHGAARARALIRQYEWHASSPNGNKKSDTYKFNVLLTTYEMVMADSSHLRGVPWEVLVVDEGHRLKNSSSKLFSLLNTFSFQHRVLLTGTPLQNNLGEMYNLLNFLQPASFPSLASFEEKFNDLTTAEKVEELKKLVAPHMLRRLKKDAMQNIPPKTERIVPVELSSIQTEYYRAMLTKNYQILRNIGKGVGQQSMMNIVMQLRKVCNHPYLIQGTEPESGSIEFLHDMRIKASAKLTLLHSMLRILHKEGHRVLIFSQMTKLLDILEDYLNIEYGPKTFERVDGSVSVADRQTAIARFNQDKNRFVFLLSTRSCGLGINLATADTVIIYDSDFNPHADIQAMNRAHRIGQSKRLLVYRLVVRASVEERILQLAKKKLMLDQLFVNKSESQKEVEDILRWGTEELFNDYSPMAGKDSGESNSNKDEVCVNVEQKHKRRTGGLGDVYQDKCTDGNPKIVWDENAIIKLLDRSNLQSGSPDNAEGDIENDILGSVKSLDWNDEPTEEQGGTDFLPGVTDDASGQNSDKKEDTLGFVTEENEWDRLLRVRWEKHQSEEEAALGRGKRMRKAVSYREAYASHLVETLSENGADDGPEPEPEPEREYTPAGRALKAKFTMLRARQKERLARKTAAEASALVGLSGHQSYPFPSSNVQDRNNVQNRSDKPVSEKASTINMEDRRGQTLEAPKSKADPNLRSGKTPKLKMNSNLDISMKHFAHHALDSLLPNHHLPGTSYANSLPNSNLLPVLGLCAPNANQMESSQRNIPKSYNRQSRQGIGVDFPFHIAPCTAGTSNEMDVKSQETASDKVKLPDFSLESFHHRQKTRMPDHCLPFNSHTVAALQGKGAEASESPGAFNDFPNLPFDETMPKLPFPGRNLSHSQPDLFPSLSLGSRIRDSNSSCFQDLPTMPLLPNLKFPQDIPLYNQQEHEGHPSFGLGQMLPTLSSLPENHRKVLENIMMRNGSGSGNLGKKKLVKDFWSEDELDFLWIGVRRHGRGSWDAMLRNPRLKFSKFHTAEDLAARWDEEQLKISDVPSFPTQKQPKATKSAKSSTFPSISDGMMKRALHGSRFAGPMKFQPHLTDMKLGFADLPAKLPFSHLESDQLGSHHDHPPPIPAWNTDRFRANFSSDSSAGPSDRPGTSSSLHMEQPPYMLNSLGTSSLGSLGIDLQLKDDEQCATRSWTLPNFLDQSVNLLRESRNIMAIGESGNSALLASSSKNVSNILKRRDDLAAESNSSQENKLPHWLRKAVCAPAARPPEPNLPPTVSAIAESVRILYGDENPSIPPFVVPGLPPSRPKDPRRSLKKKKKKKHRSSNVLNPPDLSGSNLYYQSTLHGDYTASTSVKPAAPFPPLSQMPGSSEGYPRLEPDLVLPSLNLHMMNPSSSSLVPSKPKKKASDAGSGLSPSPEVLQLVAACIAPPSPPPPPVPVPGSSSSSLLESDPIPVDAFVQGRVVLDTEDACGKQKTPLVPVDEVKTEETANGDSSKTQSDSTRRQPDGPDVEEEVSSEGTVSDHHVSDHES